MPSPPPGADGPTDTADDDGRSSENPEREVHGRAQGRHQLLLRPITVHTGAAATEVRHNGGFTVTLSGGDTIAADRLLVATGRQADLV